MSELCMGQFSFGDVPVLFSKLKLRGLKSSAVCVLNIYIIMKKRITEETGIV